MTISCKPGHGVVGTGVRPIRERFGEFIERDGARARGLRQLVPKLFGEEGHRRMEQAQRVIQRRENIAPCGDCDFAVRVGQLRLHPLDVPVAEIAPEKLVDRLAGFVKAEVFERSR